MQSTFSTNKAMVRILANGDIVQDDDPRVKQGSYGARSQHVSELFAMLVSWPQKCKETLELDLFVAPR